MKKELKTEAPKNTERPASNVRSSFTKEINDQMIAMSTGEMESIMKGMISSREWIAILKYTSMRIPLLDVTLRSTNPHENPHIISWSQGAAAGLSDIENYVIDLNAPKVEETEEAEQAGNTNFGTEGVV